MTNLIERLAPTSDGLTGPARRTVRGLATASVWAAPAILAVLLDARVTRRAILFRDEMATREFSRLSIGALFHATRHVDRALLPYYLLMHWWQAIFGAGAVSLRAPSVIAGALSVAIAAETARRAWGQVAGLVAGTALAVNGFFVYFSTEARPYAFVVLFIAIATLVLVTAAARPPRTRLWVVAFAAAMTLAVLGNAFAALALLPQLILLLRGWGPRIAVAAVAFPGLFAAAWLFACRSQGGELAWMRTPTPSQVSRDTLLTTGLTLPVTILLIAAGCAIVLQLRERRADPVWLLAVTLFVVPTAVLFAASAVVRPAYVNRYVVSASFASALILAAGAGALVTLATGAAHRLSGPGPRRHQVQVAGAAIICCLALAAVAAAAQPALQKTRDARTRGDDDYPVLARDLERDLRPGDTLLVVQHYDAGGSSDGLAYYDHDHAFSTTVTAALRGAGEPAVYYRRVVAVRPGQLSTVTGDGLATGTVWVLAPPHARLAAYLQRAGCTAAGPGRGVAGHRLSRLTCSGVTVPTGRRDW